MKQQDRRGISVGTIVMLVVTIVVLTASASILPRLMGTANIRIDAGSVLAALNLTDALPALMLSDIPITDATAVPGIAPTPEPIVTPAASTATPTLAPTATPVPGGSLTLTLGGSIVIDDGIRKSAYYSDSEKYDMTEILSLLQDEMASDVTLLSLDNLTDPDSKVSALNAPPAVMDMLSGAGVDLLSLGFGKAYDKGMPSLKATLDAAHERNLLTIGATDSQETSARVVTMTRNHVDIAFIHGVYSLSNASKKGMSSDGAEYAVPTAETEDLVREITLARENGADVVIVSVHWGVSGYKLNAKTKSFTQALADAGADIIIGTGSAAVQPITWLTAKHADGSISQTLCAWSLGTLLSSGRNDSNVAGMLLQLQLSWDGTTLSFGKVAYTPTYIWRYKQDGKYNYRIVASDRLPPDGMDGDHVKYMEKALKTIQTKLKDAPVVLRER